MSDNTQSQRTVLFVDDDSSFLDTVSSVMAEHSRGAWNILRANSAGDGLALLHQTPVDLMVLDIQMPVLDGVQFLQLILRKYPNLLKVVLTSEAAEANRVACLSRGAELFLEKPIHPDGFISIYAALDELIRRPKEEGFRGILRRVGLTDVLQMECLARNSSVLEINAGEEHGEIFIKVGNIIHARAGERRGEEAFNHLLALKGGEFALKPFVPPPERSINGSWEMLIMEAARVRDEKNEAPPEPDLATPAPEPEPEKAAPAAPSLTSYLPRHAEKAGPAPRKAAPTRIDEALICTADGEVLYEWQCTNSDSRISFLEFLSQKSRQLGAGLPLGNFDRLEILGPQSQYRVVTQIQAERGVFVRSSKAAPPARKA